jgi:TolB-like protein
MKRVIKLFTQIILIFVAVSGLYAQSRPRLAILPFTGSNTEDAETIAEFFSYKQEITRNFTPVQRTRAVENIVKEQQFQRSGLTDSDTISQLGKQMNADFVLAGHITSLGQSKLLLITIIHVEQLRQVAGAYREYRRIEETVNFLPDMAKRIAEASRQDASRLPRIAVLPFNALSSGVNQGDAEVLAQILATDIANSGKYQVFPRTSAIEKAMEEHRIQRTGMTDPDSIRRIGRAVNAEYLLNANFRNLGSDKYFSASILHIERAEQEGEGKYKKYQSVSDGLTLMAELARELTGDVGMDSEKLVKANEFEKYLLNIKTASAGNYTITLTEDVVLNAGIDFKGYENKIITIQGDSQRRTITKNFNGIMFSIPKNVVLILGNNLTLNCNLKTGDSLHGDVFIDDGKLEMHNGAAISNSVGTAVYVRGIFNMAGGTISACSTGVNISGVSKGGTFNMTGGSISDNRDTGVNINGNFNMSGGYISNNKSGVTLMSGTFSMSGGVISANTNSGVRVYSNSIFTMSGGTISGNTADYSGGGVNISRGVFIKTGGTIDDTNNSKAGNVVGGDVKRNSTAGPSVNLDSRVNGSQGGWE